ncbi:MAG: Inositol-1-monophosphatase [Candidatus Heimdallarchaeota archaeon LC_3]|nr:MAG: Inositol-1-monophosphatase [Candidatus Heimdallarchaeota archaeon LC_3]
MNIPQMLPTVMRASIKAGREIRSARGSNVQIDFKGENNPVTNADRKANDIIKSTLTSNYPEIGWLSEETVDDKARLNKDFVWIVDPLDGTKEFIKGIPEYAVSIALIRDKRPVLAVIHNPSTEDTFTAIKGDGIKVNNEYIKPNLTTSDPIKLLASRTDIEKGLFNKYKDKFEIIPAGGMAHKLAMVATEKADATISLTPKNEWDMAAGVLLIEEANGLVTDRNNKKFTFNEKNTIRNGLIASSRVNHAKIQNIFD